MTKLNLKNIFFVFASLLVAFVFFFSSCSKEYNMNKAIDDMPTSAVRTTTDTVNVSKMAAILYLDSLMFKTVVNKIAMIQLIEKYMINADSTKTANYAANYTSMTPDQNYAFLQQNFDPQFLNVFKAASIGQVKSYQKIMLKHQPYMDQETINAIEFRTAYGLAFGKILNEITDNY